MSVGPLPDSLTAEAEVVPLAGSMLSHSVGGGTGGAALAPSALAIRALCARGKLG